MLRFKPRYEYEARLKSEFVEMRESRYYTGFLIITEHVEHKPIYRDSYDLFKIIPHHFSKNEEELIMNISSDRYDYLSKVVVNEVCEDILEQIRNYDTKDCFTYEIYIKLKEAQYNFDLENFRNIVLELEDKLNNVEGV